MPCVPSRAAVEIVFAGIYRFFPFAGKRERTGTGVSFSLPPGGLVFLPHRRQVLLRGISEV
ncbi:MAG: hypothetical protein ACR2OF_07340 [Hyphomicrobium sp.]